MLDITYFHDTIRKYVATFGTIFNDIYINREDADGNVVATMKVPLNYMPKNKTLARLMGDPNLDRPVAITLPRMGFEIMKPVYDQSRKLNTIQRGAVKVSPNKDKLYYQYQCVPYNFMFELYILTKSNLDATKIVEQILPFFHPDITVNVNLIPELDEKYDISIVLNDVNSEYMYEGSFAERPVYMWTLSFTLKGYIFGPTKTQAVIKKAITKIFATPTAQDFATVSPDVSELDMRVTITPGQDANGNPTSNSEITIPYEDIQADENWDFIIEFDHPDDT